MQRYPNMMEDEEKKEEKKKEKRESVDRISLILRLNQGSGP